MSKVAIIITGDVRNCMTKDNIIKQFEDYDVFCGSYKKHADYINRIGRVNNSVLINPDTDIRFPKGLDKTNMQHNMLQWLHLDNILREYKNELLEYDVILKFRFDCRVTSGAFNETLKNLKAEPGDVHSMGDCSFYAEPHTFFKAFEDFYDTIQDGFVHKDDMDNSFEKSWKSEAAFTENLKMKKLVDKRPLFFSFILDRGGYHKVVADGNKRLYEGAKLLGKFS
jgi:hypothetical protein